MSTVLGYLGGRVESPSDLKWTSTFVGGQPTTPKQSPPLNVTPCPECSTPLQLVLQAYAPVDDFQNRILYLFGCMECASTKSFEVIRLIQVEPPKKEITGQSEQKFKKKEAKQSNTESKTTTTILTTTTKDNSDAFNWNTDSNWGDNDSTFGSTNPDDSWGFGNGNDGSSASSDLDELLKLRDLSISEQKSMKKTATPKKNQKKSRQSQTPKPEFPEGIIAEWIEVDFEELSEKEETNKELELDEPSSEGEAWGDEAYEKIKVYDDYFGPFMKAVERSPEQFLRYSFDGSALWVRKNEEEIPCCEGCGAPREFEFQLMPLGLNWMADSLVRSSKAKSALIGLGTIMVFSCSESCFSIIPKSVESTQVFHQLEHVVVQESV